MLRQLAFAAVVLWPLASSAADLKVGDLVFLKPDARATKNGIQVDAKTIQAQVFIVEINEDSVSLGKAWVRKSDVMTADEALECYDDAINRDPQNARAYLLRGSVTVSRAVMSVALINSTAAARKYMADLESALRDFSQAIKLDPSNAEAYFVRGNTALQSGKADAAMKDLTEAIRLCELNVPELLPSVYLGRAGVWEAKGEFGKAIEDCDQAIKADPKCASALCNVARLKSVCSDERVRDVKAAIQYATKAYELVKNEKGVELWYYLDTLATAYAKAGDFPNAVKWEQLAVSQLKDSDGSEFTRVWATKLCTEHLNLYRANKTSPTPQMLVDATPREIDDEQEQQPITRMEDDWADRFEKLDEAIKLDPTNAHAYHVRGDTWAVRAGIKQPGRDMSVVFPETAKFCENALSDLNEAIRLNPNIADAYATRGKIFAVTGKVDAAIQDLNQAIQLDQNQPSAYVSRGDCWNGKGEYDKAVKDWTAGLRCDFTYNKQLRKDLFERIARLRATRPDETYRNGKEAVKFAMQAYQSGGVLESVCELASDLIPAQWTVVDVVETLADAYSDNVLACVFESAEFACEERRTEFELYDTVAAAFAEAGDFPEAIKWQQKALENASEYSPVPPGYQERLELYQAHKPYRDVRQK